MSKERSESAERKAKKSLVNSELFQSTRLKGSVRTTQDTIELGRERQFGPKIGRLQKNPLNPGARKGYFVVIFGGAATEGAKQTTDVGARGDREVSAANYRRGRDSSIQAEKM